MKLVSLVITLTFLSACTAYKIRPEQAEINREKFLLPGNVKIVTSSSEGNGERWLAEDLVRYKLSESVLLSTANKETLLIVKLNSAKTGKCFSEPMLTALTLGVVPTVGCTETGYRIELTDDKGVILASASSRSEVKTVFGIAAWFLMLTPAWVSERGIINYEARSIVDSLSEVNDSAE